MVESPVRSMVAELSPEINLFFNVCFEKCSTDLTKRFSASQSLTVYRENGKRYEPNFFENVKHYIVLSLEIFRFYITLCFLKNEFENRKYLT